MDDSRLLYFGILMVVLFSIGIFYTIKEFREIDPEKQREREQKRKKMTIDKES